MQAWASQEDMDYVNVAGLANLLKPLDEDSDSEDEKVLNYE